MFKTSPRALRRFWLTAAALSGCVFQFGWLPTCRGALTTVNPCGTILNCEPEDIDLLFSDIPNWELDPTCTVTGFGFGGEDGEIPQDVDNGCADQPIYPTTPGPRP